MMMKQEVSRQQYLSTVEDCLLLLTPPLMRVPKLRRSIQAATGLNQDLAEQTLQFRILVMTHIIKQSRLQSHPGFTSVCLYPMAGIFKNPTGD